MTLTFGRTAPATGTADSMVIFVHGFGANGADLLGLSAPLAPHLPRTVFIAPDAPERCPGSPGGFQWFPIPRLDGSTQLMMEEGFARATTQLQAFIDERLAEEGIAPERLVLIGFSQGSMMSLEVGPRRVPQIGGIVAFSGKLIGPERLADAPSRPPVLLAHGDQDPVVPFEEMGLAGDALVSAGFQTFGHVMKDTGHGIAPDGLSVALSFLRDRLG
ncbi:alpha/beta hydrolase [Falsirhodobacter algicola]|uniref:Alpha/beta fold hydrolase n=1 Tax=Falsirhodobacter algicola TaxID=2692330 RepID=A0A8J8MRM3_9RHOB|nr:alpha/beta fold hydrolase [Falsirhodobacter algicola]QUS35431.1 alpha/beta fold hydrolase [Falsirhodobacter algicola]